MKKIFLGGPCACGVHNEKSVIEDYIWLEEELELVDDYKDADIIIIIDTCMGTYSTIEYSINYLEKVLSTKQENSQVIVSGCLTKELNFELPKRYQKILNQVIQVPSSKIIEYVLKLLEIEITKDIAQKFKMPAISYIQNGIQISPVEGCLNHCSFCKTNYMNFSLRSVPLENIELLAQDIRGCNEQTLQPINYINIHSSNFSLYGVDLYSKSKAHEVLNILSQLEQVKFIGAGALINWYPELLKEILNNQKVKCIFISLESGSERIYNLMNRPITLVKLIEVIKTIKKYRPDIIINTEFICGFPTETKDDLDKTIELVQELDINPIFVHDYANSLQIPASTLPQYSPKYCRELLLYAEEKLVDYRNKKARFINNCELLVIDKDFHLNMYMVMRIDGNIRYINFAEFNKEYNINDIIPTNTSGKSRRLQITTQPL